MWPKTSFGSVLTSTQNEYVHRCRYNFCPAEKKKTKKTLIESKAKNRSCENCLNEKTLPRNKIPFTIRKLSFVFQFDIFNYYLQLEKKKKEKKTKSLLKNLVTSFSFSHTFWYNFHLNRLLVILYYFKPEYLHVGPMNWSRFKKKLIRKWTHKSQGKHLFVRMKHEERWTEMESFWIAKWNNFIAFNSAYRPFLSLADYFLNLWKHWKKDKRKANWMSLKRPHACYNVSSSCL